MDTARSTHIADQPMAIIFHVVGQTESAEKGGYEISSRQGKDRLLRRIDHGDETVLGFRPVTLSEKAPSRLLAVMEVNRLRLVFFSPTGTTRKILEAIARGTNMPYRLIDLTPPASRTRELTEFHEELVVVGCPVYGGRVPLEAEQRLRKLKGNETPVVPVVVYGNRAYEDALLELSDLVSEQGFKPVAAGAFIGEHSYSTPLEPIASGRPDSEDLEEAGEFGEKLHEKLSASSRLQSNTVLTIPGNRPYRPRSALESPSRTEPVSPLVKVELCNMCGRCRDVCPNDAVVLGATVFVKEDRCIACYACFKNCPTGALVMRPRIVRISERLHTNLHERKQPEFFL